MKKIRLAILILMVLLAIFMAALPVFAWPPAGEGKGPTGGEPPGWAGSTPGSGGSGHTGQPPYGP